MRDRQYFASPEMAMPGVVGHLTAKGKSNHENTKARKHEKRVKE
jgi:hypothetical protein